MHVSMLSPRGRGPRAYVGHLTSIAFPILGNLTKNLGPRVGTFAFLHGGMGPSHIVPCVRLCADADFRFVKIDAIFNGRCHYW